MRFNNTVLPSKFVALRDIREVDEDATWGVIDVDAEALA